MSEETKRLGANSVGRSSRTVRSRNRPPIVPLIIVPTKPSSPTARAPLRSRRRSRYGCAAKPCSVRSCSAQRPRGAAEAGRPQRRGHSSLLLKAFNHPGDSDTARGHQPADPRFPFGSVIRAVGGRSWRRPFPPTGLVRSGRAAVDAPGAARTLGYRPGPRRGTRQTPTNRGVRWNHRWMVCTMSTRWAGSSPTSAAGRLARRLAAARWEWLSDHRCGIRTPASRPSRSPRSTTGPPSGSRIGTSSASRPRSPGRRRHHIRRPISVLKDFSAETLAWPRTSCPCESAGRALRHDLGARSSPTSRPPTRR